MSQQVQLDVANQLASEGKHEKAARAYELFLDKHDQYHDLAQVKLMLGLIYARYLEKKQRARELVEDARGELKSGPYAQLAESLHEELAT
jgi:outer membrane protein assembly factor BamD (BamD/ComL family)